MDLSGWIHDERGRQHPASEQDEDRGEPKLLAGWFFYMFHGSRVFLTTGNPIMNPPAFFPYRHDIRHGQVLDKFDAKAVRCQCDCLHFVFLFVAKIPNNPLAKKDRYGPIRCAKGPPGQFFLHIPAMTASRKIHLKPRLPPVWSFREPPNSCSGRRPFCRLGTCGGSEAIRCRHK